MASQDSTLYAAMSDEHQYAIHLWAMALRCNEKWGLHEGFNDRRNSVYSTAQGKFESIPIPNIESFERRSRELPMLQFVFYNKFFQGAM
eukprot:3233599-Ditylum_brightwellii.AAC.1